MGPSGKRGLLYGIGICLAGALFFVGFVVKLPPDIDQLLSNASFEVKMGAIGSARDHLSQALRREPGNWKALWMDGYCAEREGKNEEALGRYREAWAHAIEVKHRDELQAAIDRLLQTKSPQNGEKEPKVLIPLGR